jgi:hypothetical protein
MTGRKLIVSALAVIASTTIALATPAQATPVGPCAEVPYVGVCVPASEHPSPPPQQSSGETAFVPNSTGSIPFVN